MRFTRDARSAWRGILEVAAATRPQTVLLPAYIGRTDREGSGVFDPVEETRSQYEFYAVRSDLSIDTEHFIAGISSGRVTIALVIHYFGLCRNNITEIRRQCDLHDVVLVEDCAHVLPFPGLAGDLGSYGDFTFYSLHKQLPLQSGGMVRWKEGSVCAADLFTLDRPSSDVVEQYALTDARRVAAARRTNFARYAAELAGERCDIMFTLCDRDVPMNFPIRVPGLRRREKLYFELMENGLPTIALYYRLIDQIDPSAFPVSHAVSSEILNLPVHQDITGEDITRLCNAVRAFLRGTPA